MSEDSDYLYALEVQKQLNGALSDSDIEEVEFKAPTRKPLVAKRSNPRSNLDEEFLNRTQNLVHPMWETLDPTPDVTSLFEAFDKKFFQRRLRCVTLEWSKRMYSCAGICYSRRNRLGMEITIRLSEPLLKLRPRKDLVETMLHEMIHAYCFVLNIREGNGGHGPNFKRIMVAINKVAGTNITVYHTFQDEVNLYKQHWWRCNGSCQHHAPFFGYVKRTCNRQPGHYDQWWAEHQRSCGGTFMKIKGPEKKPKASTATKENKKKTGGSADLRKFFTPTNGGAPKPHSAKPPSSGGAGKGFVKTNGGGTLVLNPKQPKAPLSGIAAAFPPTSYPGLSTDPFNTASGRMKSTAAVVSAGGNLSNVRSLGDISAGKGSPATAGLASMTGRGFSLTSSATGVSSIPSQVSPGKSVDRKHLRDVWAKRFGGDSPSKPHSTEEGNAKRRRLSLDQSPSVAEKGDKDWLQMDDDVYVQEPQVDVILLSSDEGSDDDESDVEAVKTSGPKFNTMNPAERQAVIKQEILDETIDLQDEDIQLIDDEYDDDDISITGAAEIADSSIIDEFFGDDTLLKEFKNENDVRPTGSRYVADPMKDIITCPICQSKLQRGLLAEHLNGCMGIAETVELPPSILQKFSKKSRNQPLSQRTAAQKKKGSNTKKLLRNAGYSEADLANIDSLSSEADTSAEASLLNSSGTIDLDSPREETERQRRQRGLFKSTIQCPNCAEEVEPDLIDIHLECCCSE